MGLIYTDIDLSNPRDDALSPLTVSALVDTGSITLCVPEHVAVQLDLKELERREVTTADGKHVLVPYVGPVRVKFANRSCYTGALVLGDGVLLGSIPLEDMDLVVNSRLEKVTVNPESPNIPSAVVKQAAGLVLRSGAEHAKEEQTLIVGGQEEIKQEVRRIYAEANAYADEVGGVERGMNILYTPPMFGPKLMVVSVQGAGDDGVRQGTWPDHNQYAVSPYSFGQKMTADFDDAGMSELFRLETVATNLVFAQAKEFDKWRRTCVGKGWLERSRRWLDELIGLMAPGVLLTYGSPPFEELTGEPKAGGEIAEATYRGIPVVGCSHYSHNWATPEERGAVMARIRELTGAYGERNGSGLVGMPRHPLTST